MNSDLNVKYSDFQKSFSEIQSYFSNLLGKASGSYLAVKNKLMIKKILALSKLLNLVEIELQELKDMREVTPLFLEFLSALDIHSHESEKRYETFINFFELIYSDSQLQPEDELFKYTSELHKAYYAVAKATLMYRDKKYDDVLNLLD